MGLGMKIALDINNIKTSAFSFRVLEKQNGNKIF